MKNKTGIIGVVLLLCLVTGCAKFKSITKRQPGLAEQYTAKAQEYEVKGDLVEALEQYKLVLTVEPENQLAKAKSEEIGQKVRKLAEEHYQTGLGFHRKGEYGKARKEFLTALRYNPEHPEAKDMLTRVIKGIEEVQGYIQHTIQPDETLATLADRYYGDHRKFHLIAQYNELEDATKIRVGQEIRIPVIEGIPIMADPAAIRTDTGEALESMPGKVITVKSYVTHTVQPGESLAELAKMYYGDHKKFDLIAKFNGLEDPTGVRVGQKIKVPEIEGVPFLEKEKVEETKEAKIDEGLTVIKEIPKLEEEKAGLIKEQITIEDQVTNYRELGIELFKNKEYAGAITEFQKVLNVHPEDSETLEYLAKSHFEQGLVLFAKEDYLAARDEFKATLRYDRDCDKCEKNIQESEERYKDVHYGKGLSYFGEEKLADAIREWELVYTLDTQYKDVDKNLKKARTLLERLESIRRSKTKGGQQ
ncbi:MAG: LysM peptidoglycan-binding domain-containing protein [Proteobacteria bacterium]|nr:LysM peptidoglycan-binding domain-containing protein [Pseudomonadota bacterium]NIS71321.1 LysM peptidoglycan-binding domain-containing protein [Pseudomonadota bacterium]